MCLYVYMYIYLYIYVHMYVCMYICIYAYVGPAAWDSHRAFGIRHCWALQKIFSQASSGLRN